MHQLVFRLGFYRRPHSGSLQLSRTPIDVLGEWVRPRVRGKGREWKEEEKRGGKNKVERGIRRKEKGRGEERRRENGKGRGGGRVLLETFPTPTLLFLVRPLLLPL